MASVSHRRVPGFIEPPKFEEYRAKYQEHIVMERRDGVIMLRMHTQGKALVWSPQLHRAIHQAVAEVSADPENQVLILTATGDFWVAYGVANKDEGYVLQETTTEQRAQASMDIFVGDGIPLQENLVFDVRIPTIAAINGPGYHMDMALMCDLAICTDDTVMVDVHKWMGFVSGDGINIAYQELMGSKRANYAMLLGTPVTAQQALDWGMVNEVVSRERIYDRAWELGAAVAEGGNARRVWRRMMTEIMRKPLKTRMAEDFTGAFAAEMYGYMADPGVSHDDDALAVMWDQCGVEVPEWE
ncbi:MAG TPA: enoyl-CoA hydratase/isomerase family protein [Trebonia sp.]|jgi:enoyl-CoA hydratase/carnithine racemase|nr:enoyl-CoA hydratase/isomerase family protein [Trebonia sp.]